MLIQAHSPNSSISFLAKNLSFSRHRHHFLYHSLFVRRKEWIFKISASGEQRSSFNLEKKRKVFEHISLLKARENISEEEENNMLDYIYTTQYQMGGVVAVSLGRACDQNNGNYTHGVYMRFQRKEDLENFYVNPFYLGVLKDHVMPYCHGLIHVDYESEVEDDMLPIFRKGEEFNYGVEFVLLIKFLHDSFGGPLEDALNSLERLTIANPSLVVQFTLGLNFNPSCKEFTHGVVIRFRSRKHSYSFMFFFAYNYGNSNALNVISQLKLLRYLQAAQNTKIYGGLSSNQSSRNPFRFTFPLTQ